MPQERKELFEVVDVEDPQFENFISDGGSGLLIVAEPKSDGQLLVLSSDAGDFSKWIRQTTPSIHVTMPSSDCYTIRRSGDIWLPLVFLAGDVMLTLYLGLVSNYLYDRLRGAIKEDTSRVNFSVIYLDQEKRVSKKLSYDGDIAGFRILAEKISLGDFSDERRTDH